MENRYLDLANYELEKARHDLKSAKDNFRILEDYDAAANRSYYSMFHLMAAAMALKQLQFTRHTGLIKAFREKYIKTGIVDKELSKYITYNEELRNDADYNRTDRMQVGIPKEDALESIERTEKFYDEVEPVVLALKEELERGVPSVSEAEG